MPSTRVVLPARILAILGNHAIELSSLLFEDAMYASAQDNGNIEIGFDAVIVAPEGAPPFDHRTRGFFLCRDGFLETCHTRLDNDGLCFLLERARDLILRHSELTGHDRLEIAVSFSEAIQASSSAVTANHAAPRENTAAVKLAATLRPELDVLDAAACEYFRSISCSFLEGPIASLGFQVELAEGLLIGNARTAAGARKAVLMRDPNRKAGRYQSALEISDMLELYSQRVSPFRFGTHGTVDWRLVETLHFNTFKRTFDRAGKVRHVPALIRRQGRDDMFADGLAQERIAAAMEQWSTDFALDQWQNMHWLIRVALAHLAFEKIHPFSDGNGRIGRLVMHLQIAESGKPLLPLEAAIWRSRQNYLLAIDEAIISGNAEPFVRYLIAACRKSIEIGMILFDELRPAQLQMAADLRKSGLIAKRHALLAAQLLARFVLEHRDFDYIFELPSHGVMPLVEQSCRLEMIDVEGKQRWIVPGLQDIVKRAFA